MLHWLYRGGVLLQDYLADGTFDKSGLSISRKLVSKVFLEVCALELPGDTIFGLPSVPFSILIASCMAKMISCILGLETPCCSTHWIATSAILQTDSILTFPTRKGSMTLIISPLWIKDLACKTTGLIYYHLEQDFEWENIDIEFPFLVLHLQDAVFVKFLIYVNIFKQNISLWIVGIFILDSFLPQPIPKMSTI